MGSVVERLSNKVSGPVIANSAVNYGETSNISRLQDFQTPSNFQCLQSHDI